MIAGTAQQAQTILGVLEAEGAQDVKKKVVPSEFFNSPQAITMVFTLFVSMVFNDEASEKVFLDAMTPYSAWVNANEPNTLVYAVMKSDKDGGDLRYGVCERYAEKERDFLNTHRNSQQFVEFRSVLKSLQENGKVIVDGESYNDVA